MKLSDLKYVTCFCKNHNRTAEDVCPYIIMQERKPLPYKSENVTLYLYT